MATQVTIYSSIVDKIMPGYQGLSLTHITDAAAMAIAAGSKLEVGGALYEWTIDETPAAPGGGFVNSTLYYIMITPSGSSASASYVTAAPTWDTSKQSWYATGTSNRYIASFYRDSSGNYTQKRILDPLQVAANLMRWGDGTSKFTGILYDKNGREILAKNYITFNRSDELPAGAGSWRTFTLTFVMPTGITAEAIEFANFQQAIVSGGVFNPTKSDSIYIESFTPSSGSVVLVVKVYQSNASYKTGLKTSITFVY